MHVEPKIAAGMCCWNSAAHPVVCSQVLSTRVYRGRPARGSGLSVVSLGGAAVLESGAAWEMSGCWEEGGEVE